MKKILLLTFIAICTCIIIPVKAYSIEISVGPKIWYASWIHDGGIDWSDGTSWVSTSLYGGEDGNNGNALLYGPELSIKLNDYYSVTLIYLFGQYDVTSVVNYWGIAPPPSQKFKSKVKKHDADLTLNAKFGDNFKLHIGAKYINLSADYKHSGFGPALGFTITMPVPMADNIFILFNAGGFYLSSKESSNYYATINSNDFGFDGGLSLAYYTDPISINLGYNGQYIKPVYKENDTLRSQGGYSIFHGLTLSATYSFGI